MRWPFINLHGSLMKKPLVHTLTIVLIGFALAVAVVATGAWQHATPEISAARADSKLQVPASPVYFGDLFDETKLDRVQEHIQAF